MSHRIDAGEHTRRAWKAKELLAPDFEIEDVWRLPVELEERHSLAIFEEQFRLALETMMQSGLAAKLFQLRFFLGRLFGWDAGSESAANTAKERPARHPRPKPGSLRARFAAQSGNDPSVLPAPNSAIDGNFEAVYHLENESLAELENATVHAALHLGRVPSPDRPSTCTIELTVYVKPKGLFGRSYMSLIKPFRLAIVYPAIMAAAQKQWSLYLSREKSS